MSPPQPPNDPTIGAPAGAAPVARRAHWRIDLAGVVAITLGCHAHSSAVELSARVSRMLARCDRWQADELPLRLYTHVHDRLGWLRPSSWFVSVSAAPLDDRPTRTAPACAWRVTFSSASRATR
jgi:hypothetical protein